jgi:hypothetical protein
MVIDVQVISCYFKMHMITCHHHLHHFHHHLHHHHHLLLLLLEQVSWQAFEPLEIRCNVPFSLCETHCGAPRPRWDARHRRRARPFRRQPIQSFLAKQSCQFEPPAMLSCRASDASFSFSTSFLLCRRLRVRRECKKSTLYLLTIVTQQFFVNIKMSIVWRFRLCNFHFRCFRCIVLLQILLIPYNMFGSTRYQENIERETKSVAHQSTHGFFELIASSFQTCVCTNKRILDRQFISLS